jgi:hypothetical protein
VVGQDASGAAAAALVGRLVVSDVDADHLAGPDGDVGHRRVGRDPCAAGLGRRGGGDVESERVDGVSGTEIAFSISLAKEAFRGRAASPSSTVAGMPQSRQAWRFSRTYASGVLGALDEQPAGVRHAVAGDLAHHLGFRDGIGGAFPVGGVPAAAVQGTVHPAGGAVCQGSPRPA